MIICQIEREYSGWISIPFGVPQGSILGLLISLVLVDFFFFIVDEIDFASYAEGSTPYVNSSNIDAVI